MMTFQVCRPLVLTFLTSVQVLRPAHTGTVSTQELKRITRNHSGERSGKQQAEAAQIQWAQEDPEDRDAVVSEIGGSAWYSTELTPLRTER